MPDVLDIGDDGPSDAPDKFGAAPHPRQVLFHVGHAAQERALLEAYRQGRLHHAWLFAGPEGVGKATLAYRFARFLLAFPDPAAAAVRSATTLEAPAGHPVVRQVARGAHPDLAVIRRGLAKDGKSWRAETVVSDVRDGLAILRRTAGAEGWRIVIVDAADDMNVNAANALLKLLEEPPERAVLILVAHQPGGLLPTIRSRCRLLRFRPLDDAAVAEVVVRIGAAGTEEARAAAAQAGGGVRDALRLLDAETAEIRAMLDWARRDGSAALALAERLNGRQRTEAFAQFVAAVEDRLRSGLTAGGAGAALAARAELWEKLTRGAREVETYNLDRRPLILSVLSELAAIEGSAR